MSGKAGKMAGENNATAGFGDTAYTKIFVGGLAWETKRDTLKHYFEQFGEILEAVVINDKTTGRSKGYGFVTFTDAESAMRACHNPFPVIDGRRANCNLAFLGAQKNRPPSASHHGMEKVRASSPRVVMAPPSPGTPAFYRQLIPQFAFPYSAYGYPGNYTAQDIYPTNYYNAYSGQGQQFPSQSHYTTGTSATPGGGGVYLSYYPLYVQHQHQHQHQHGQSSPSPSPSQYPKFIHYPYSPHQYYRPVGTLTLAPPPSSSSLSATGGAATTEVSGMPGTASAQNSSA